MTSIFKKAAIVAIALVTISVSAWAQTSSFVKGDNVVGASIGFGGFYSGSWYSSASRLPFIALYYENCVKDNLFDENSALGIGAILGHTSIKWSDNWKYSNTIIGLRGALHYAFVDNLDTYTGLMLGYDIWSHKYYGSWSGGNYSGGSSGLAFSWFLGARYYFNDNIAALCELGYGVAPINIGLALKF